MKCLLLCTFATRPHCSFATRCNVSFERKKTSRVRSALWWILLIILLLVDVSCANVSRCSGSALGNSCHLFWSSVVFTWCELTVLLSPRRAISSASLDWLPLLAAALLMPHKGPLCASEAPAGPAACVPWLDNSHAQEMTSSNYKSLLFTRPIFKNHINICTSPLLKNIFRFIYFFI